jgi:dolichol-phosphate mannosyltransferase
MIYFVIPIYNEALNIPNLHEELMGVLKDEKVFYVFSDDGSRDGSADLLKREFEGNDFVVLGDGVNRGPGAAFNTGFEWVLEHSKNKEDLVVSIEADCTSDISILGNMVHIARMNFDLVLASVYAQSGGFEKTTFMRRLISAAANLIMRFAFNIRVLTLSSFYRVYHVDLLRKIKAKDQVLIREAGFICMLEILLKAIRCEARVIEVPTTLHSSKRKGKSKMKMLKTTRQYLGFLMRNAFQAR